MIIDENTNLEKFWLTEDGLNMTSNLYFGLGKSYFCGHGCHVCFIREDLKKLKQKTPLIYNNDLPKMKKVWDEVYSFFVSISLDEDPYYFKLNHQKEYQWYVENAYKCSYGTTDNGIFRMRKLKEIKFKDFGEVALSISFIEKVGEDKIIGALNDLMPIAKIKFLIDKSGKRPNKIIEWVRDKNVPVVIHRMDFTTGIETDFVLEDCDDLQDVDWVLGKNGDELVKIHINSDMILYYDSFYFSNNTGDIPYFKLNSEFFDYKKFLSGMLEGKQKNYLTYFNLTDNKTFKDYFMLTQNYKINHEYNFIPNFMVDYKVRFFHRMIELGWKATKYGLIESGAEKLVPIIERKL